MAHLYIDREAPFVLTRPIHLVIGSDEPFRADVAQTCRSFLDRTRQYWSEWVRRLSTAYEWQDAIIRAAISLKLSSFDETGGIIAAHTTSIPEAPHSGRNWDYRYCWLRDAYVVKALNCLGATQTMEDFISFILGIASERVSRPVYSIVPSDSIEERIATGLKGYRGDGPVRVGNAAVHQAQHDTFGSIILAAMPMFYVGLPRLADETLFTLLERLGVEAERLAFEPDAGIWEYRGRTRVHTHSAAMCWAGCSRLSAIASHLGLSSAPRIGPNARPKSSRDCWPNPGTRARRFHAGFGVDDLDAIFCCCPISGLSMPTIRASSVRSMRSNGNFSVISTLCGTRVRMISAFNPRFWSAASG